MSPAVLIDANVPIYAGGRDHPLKAACVDVLRIVSDHPLVFLTSAEILQELLHHYLARRQWGQGQMVFREFAALMFGRVEAVYAADVERAAMLAQAHGDLEGRDLVHAAVMQRLGLTRIISADRGFDRIAGIERLDPANLAAWRDSLAL